MLPVPQQAKLLQGPGGQVLRLVQQQHEQPAALVQLEQVPFELLDERLKVRGGPDRHAGAGGHFALYEFKMWHR